MKYLFNSLMKKLVYRYAPGDPPEDPFRYAGSQVTSPATSRAPLSLSGFAKA